MTKAREFAAAWAKNPPKNRDEFIVLKDAHQGMMDMQKKLQIDFPDESFVILFVPHDGGDISIDKVYDCNGIKVMHVSDDEIEPPNTLAGEFMAEVGRLLMTRGLLNTMLKKHNATRRHNDTTVFFSDGSGILLKTNEDNRFFVEKEIRDEPVIDNKPLPTSWGAKWPEPVPTPDQPPVPRIEVEEDLNDCWLLVTEEDTFLGAPGHWWRADSREGVGDAKQKELNELFSSLTGKVWLHSGTDTPKTRVINPDPKWTARIMQHALNGPRMDDSEMLEMFADEANWKQVYQDGRCWWAWCGPVLPPWQWIQHAREITDKKGS